jgi:hypothetical protein
MDKLNKYRQILQSIVEKYAAEPRRPEQVPLVPICDNVHDNYLLLRVGWDRLGRTHHTLFHFRIVDGKVRIEHDGIEHGIANDLLEAGIDAADIILAFQKREPKPVAELVLS